MECPSKISKIRVFKRSSMMPWSSLKVSQVLGVRVGEMMRVRWRAGRTPSRSASATLTRQRESFICSNLHLSCKISFEKKSHCQKQFFKGKSWSITSFFFLVNFFSKWKLFYCFITIKDTPTHFPRFKQFRSIETNN